MSLQEKGKEIEQNEVQVFFELIEREAHRVHLLKENNRLVAQKPLTTNQVVWKPSFEMGDFDYLSRGSFKANCSEPPLQPSANGGEGRPGDEGEKGGKRGLKRPGDSFDLASFLPKEKITKTSRNDVVLSDLDKESESLYGAKNWSLWYNS